LPKNNRKNTMSIIQIKSLSAYNKNMIVYHPNHNLSVGQTIEIENSVSVNQIPASIINRKHNINKIIDSDHYLVLLDLYTKTGYTETRSNTITIMYPDLFQMFFNYDNTLGKILSFRDVGREFAVTPFRHVIRNTDAYAHDNHTNYLDSLGSPYKPGLRKLDMTGENYFYICCPELATIENTDPVRDVFAIGRWFDNPGSVVFDSVVPTIKVFQNPLTLSSLHISIRKPDGHLVNFNGLDHSFTLELTELVGHLGDQRLARSNQLMTTDKKFDK
jgi:hypothetical protein